MTGTKLISILVLILMLAVLGCEPTNGSGDADDTRKGTKELTLKSSTLPTIVFENDRWEGDLILENQAGYDVTNIKVGLNGLNLRYVELNEYEQNLNFLEGRSRLQLAGGISELEILGTIKEILPGKREESLTYFIVMEYSSKVEFSPVVCIDSGQYVLLSGCKVGEVKDKPSDHSKTKTFSGQGAPLAITDLEVRSYTGTNNEVELRMKVNKRGRGNVKSIRLGQATLGNIPLECEFIGRTAQQPHYIVFEDKTTPQETLLSCTGRLESVAPYETALFVELFYDYILEVRKELTIQEGKKKGLSPDSGLVS